MRSRKALIEKLRLKNSTLKVQKKKLQLQLKQKEEMGEVSFFLLNILSLNEYRSCEVIKPVLRLFHQCTNSSLYKSESLDVNEWWYIQCF